MKDHGAGMLRQRAIFFRNVNIAADTAVMFVAFTASYFIRRDVLPGAWPSIRPFLQPLFDLLHVEGNLAGLKPADYAHFVPIMAVIIPIWMICLISQGMYKTHRVHSLFKIVWVAIRGIGLGAVITFATLFVFKMDLSRPLIGLCAATSFLVVVAENVAAREILRALRARGYN
ncbi:MAG: hypothetical protein K8I02_08900, partial [Candidatus Methylomirabilis sp.]|nr:hypothetical protein [Deltaproteobacteria bacterium]